MLVKAPDLMERSLIATILILVYIICSHSVLGQVTSNFKCAGGCCDQHEFCAFWARVGECANNDRWMVDNCLISCNTCARGATTPAPVLRPVTQPPAFAPPAQNNPAPRGTCTDTDDLCKFWSRVGECQRNPRWMNPNCALSCNACNNNNLQGNSVVPAPQPQSNFQPQPQPQPQRQQQQQQPAQQTNQQRGQPPEGCQFVSSKEDTRFRRVLGLQDVQNSNTNQGCVPPLSIGDCNQNLCFHKKFRSLDGMCNNLQQPLKGAAFTPFTRLQFAKYDDGTQAAGLRNRPSAREVSRFLLSSDRALTNNFNMLLMQWGQFITHDITKSTQMNNNPCSTCNTNSVNCVNIPTTAQDFRFGPQACLPMARSSAVCGTGGAVVREQYNENTAYVDASVIYGSSISDLPKFRDGFTPFLKTSFINGRIFPTADTNNNFVVGDDRGNIFLALTALHTLFIREHNRIARNLQLLNPHWASDRIFEETRKIVGAQLQVITYDTWLPKIMGASFNTHVGQYNSYDSSVNPAISNVFASCAFRMGHGMITDFYQRLGPNFQSIPEGGYRFEDGVFQPTRLTTTGIDPVLRGLMGMACKLPQRLAQSVTERMFGTSDLCAMNIQRGRDHGIATYNTWREHCGLARANTFDELANEIVNVQMRQGLQTMYGHPDNIDLYVGGMLESPIGDSMIGPTFACIIGEQFKRLRDGDRHWHEAPGTFTPSQLQQLKRVSLSRILCDSGEAFGQAPTDSFFFTTQANTQPCQNIPGIDLNLWKE